MPQDLRARIYDLYAAYAKGELGFVSGSFDDKAEFISYAPVDVFPYLGRASLWIRSTRYSKRWDANSIRRRFSPILPSLRHEADKTA
jgi:hypothetical protein